MTRLRRAFQEARAIRRWRRLGRVGPPPSALKHRVLRLVARAYQLRILVETGTCFGDTVAALKGSFDRVYSIELAEGLFQQARAQFAADPHVSLLEGDSGRVLAELVPGLAGPALFWLDAHYSGGPRRGHVTARGETDTPILAELDVILGAAERRHIVVIDDARLFGTDPAYPTVSDLQALLARQRPDLGLRVEEDLIRIEPRS